MEENGTIKTSISFPTTLWDEVQHVINDDKMSFSRFLQSSARLKLKAIKMNNVREFLDTLSDSEIDLLEKEIKKRS